MKIIKLVFIIFLVISLPGFAISKEKTVSIATLDDYSPYCFPTENRKSNVNDTIPPGSDSCLLQGYSWDVLRASLHEMGYTIELKVYPWARAMNSVKDGSVDLLFPTGKNSEREKIFVYSTEPVNKVNFLVYTKKDFDLKWDGISSLDNLPVGVMRGWNYGEKFEANTAIKKQPINKISQGFKMLESNRIKGFAGYEIVFDYSLKQMNQSQSFTKLPSFDSTAEYVVGLKTNEKIMEFIKDFDMGKQRIIQSGEFDKIVQKWK